MIPVVNQPFLKALESAVNSDMLPTARRMLADIKIMEQKRSRLFELAAVVELKSGKPDQAEPYLKKGVACSDASAFCHYLLGSLHLSRHEYPAAAESLTAAMKKGANFLECRYNLGMALAQQGQHEEALPHFEAALQLNPQHIQAWHAKAASLDALRRPDEAEKAYLQALMLNPHYTDSQIGLGFLYHGTGRSALALQFMQAALPQVQDEKKKEHVAYLINAISNASGPERAPDDYVRDLFDTYASHFETDLVGRLKYQVPQLIQNRLNELRPQTWQHALDLGCGTGLWGKLVRAQCTRLSGLDISPKMIDQAAKLGIYDELHCQEILEHLQARPASYDLMVAADVFVYVGRLDEVFAATRLALLQGGVFGFSVELADDAGDKGYKILTSGRYAHADAYIRSLGQAHGLTLLDHFEGVGREEHGQPVRSGFYLFQPAA